MDAKQTTKSRGKPVDATKKGQERIMATKRGATWVRCMCCGEWLLIVNWDNSVRTYCEGCFYERTGNGKGECAYCKEYPQSLRHWNDPKPERVPFIDVCIR